MKIKCPSYDWSEAIDQAACLLATFNDDVVLLLRPESFRVLLS